MELLTIKQVADLLQTSPDTIQRLINDRMLASEQIRPRGKHRIRRDVLEAYVRNKGLTLKESQPK